ncbi:MAG TPA: ABC transporter substrate-binding protein [Candidatus Dormibacteraeota bacterium]
MRRLRMTTAAVAVALSLAACGGGAAGGGAQAPATQQLPALNHHVTVNFWHAMAGGSQKPTLEAITKAFNESQSNVTVNLQVYPDYSTLLQKTLAALAAGSPPDMAQCYENWAAKYNQSKALANLTPYVTARDGLTAEDLKDYWPAMLNDGKLGGTYYMWPFNKSDSVLFYNADMFRAAGIDHPPATWDEFAADARKLTVPGQRWGTDFSLAGGYESLWESMNAQYGGSLLNKDQTKSTFNAGPGQQAIQVFADLVKGGYAHRVQGFEDENDLGSQHIGMMVNTIAGYSFVDRAVGGKFALKTAPVPAGPRGPSVEMFGTNACVFSKASQDVQQGAFQYIKYFTNAQNTAQWSQQTGYMPVRQSAFKSLQTSFYPQNPNLKVAVDQLPHAIFAPSVPVWDQASNAILTELANIVDGKETAKQGLDVAARKVDDLLTTG